MIEGMTLADRLAKVPQKCSELLNYRNKPLTAVLESPENQHYHLSLYFHGFCFLQVDDFLSYVVPVNTISL